MNLFELINFHYDYLNESDLHVLNYVTHNMNICAQKTLNEIAIECNISASTIIRTAQKLGFKGYSEFRYFLCNELSSNERQEHLITDSFMNSVILRDVTETIKLFEQNNHREDIYSAILNSERIFAYGTGHSQNLMIQEFARCLLNNNILLNIIPSKTEFELIGRNLGENDLLIVVSLSGNVDSVKKILNSLVVKRVPMISITLLSRNELAYLCDYNLYYQVTSLNTLTQLNNSSFVTLNLVLSLLYEGLSNYIVR